MWQCTCSERWIDLKSVCTKCGRARPWVYVLPLRTPWAKFHVRLADGRTLCGRQAAGWRRASKSSIAVCDDICTTCRGQAAAREMEIWP